MRAHACTQTTLSALANSDRAVILAVCYSIQGTELLEDTANSVPLRPTMTEAHGSRSTTDAGQR